jgi:hypothetical protein
MTEEKSISDLYLGILTERLKGGKDTRKTTLSISCPRWVKEDLLLLATTKDRSVSDMVLDDYIYPLLKTDSPESCYKQLSQEGEDKLALAREFKKIIDEQGSLVVREARTFVNEQIYKINWAWRNSDIDAQDDQAVKAIVTPERILEIVKSAVRIHKISYIQALGLVDERVDKYEDGLYKKSWRDAVQLARDQLIEDGQIQPEAQPEPVQEAAPEDLDKKLKKGKEALAQARKDRIRPMAEDADKPSPAQEAQLARDELKLIRGLEEKGKGRLTAKGEARAKELEDKIQAIEGPDALKEYFARRQAKKGQAQPATNGGQDPVQEALARAGEVEVKEITQGYLKKGRPGQGRRKKF